jgi:hypothetical protein
MPVIFIVINSLNVKQYKYLGQIVASDGTVKGGGSGRLGLAHAALICWASREFGGIDKILGRTKLTICKAAVLTILVYCAETWYM